MHFVFKMLQFFSNLSGVIDKEGNHNLQRLLIDFLKERNKENEYIKQNYSLNCVLQQTFQFKKLGENYSEGKFLQKISQWKFQNNSDCGVKLNYDARISIDPRQNFDTGIILQDISITPITTELHWQDFYYTHFKLINEPLLNTREIRLDFQLNRLPKSELLLEDIFYLNFVGNTRSLNHFSYLQHIEMINLDDNDYLHQKLFIKPIDQPIINSQRTTYSFVMSVKTIEDCCVKTSMFKSWCLFKGNEIYSFNFQPQSRNFYGSDGFLLHDIIPQSFADTLGDRNVTQLSKLQLDCDTAYTLKNHFCGRILDLSAEKPQRASLRSKKTKNSLLNYRNSQSLTDLLNFSLQCRYFKTPKYKPSQSIDYSIKNLRFKHLDEKIQHPHSFIKFQKNSLEKENISRYNTDCNIFAYKEFVSHAIKTVHVEFKKCNTSFVQRCSQILEDAKKIQNENVESNQECNKQGNQLINFQCHDIKASENKSQQPNSVLNDLGLTIGNYFNAHQYTQENKTEKDQLSNVEDKTKDVFKKDTDYGIKSIKDSQVYSDSKEHQLDGLKLIIDEQVLESYPFLISHLCQQHGISSLDFSLEEPVSFIIDDITCVCIANITYSITSTQELKNYVLKLSRLVHKWSTIWVIIYNPAESNSRSASYHQKIIETYKIGLFKAVSRFPSRIIIREVHIETNLCALIYHICVQTSREYCIKMDCLREKFIDRQYFSARDFHFEEMCEFLQFFPTINFYQAYLLLHHFGMYSLAITDPDHILAILKQIPKTSIHGLCTLLHRHIGIEVNSKRIEYNHSTLSEVPLSIKSDKQNEISYSSLMKTNPTWSQKLPQYKNVGHVINRLETSSIKLGEKAYHSSNYNTGARNQIFQVEDELW